MKQKQRHNFKKSFFIIQHRFVFIFVDFGSFLNNLLSLITLFLFTVMLINVHYPCKTNWRHKLQCRNILWKQKELIQTIQKNINKWIWMYNMYVYMYISIYACMLLAQKEVSLSFMSYRALTSHNYTLVIIIITHN